MKRSWHLDKAPDAFRTISEVADDLDIPQHVLRFWETRFTQIKPMKRSGGRRYYRPDDVDLLRGIRRLLYGEGYTIRGVQRILKEHGIKSVQGLIDQILRRAVLRRGRGGDRLQPAGAEDGDDAPEIDAGDEEDEIAEEPVEARRAPEFARTAAGRCTGPAAGTGCRIGRENGSGRRLDRERLETALQDLIACRQLLDTALKDG